MTNNAEFHIDSRMQVVLTLIPFDARTISFTSTSSVQDHCCAGRVKSSN